MLILLAIGFVAGIVTALSPCVLPVLPIVLAGGATGRRPLAIVAGIVVSFTVFTLFAAWLLDLLGLPQDLLRNLAIALLFLVALTLLVPQVGELIARPLQALTRRGSGDLGGGFFLGASLGLVFVPCAGPVLAAVTVIAAKRDVGLDGLLLTARVRDRRGAADARDRVRGPASGEAIRVHAETVRRVAGVLVAAAAIAIALGVDQDLQTVIPGYTESLQERVERSSAAQRELGELTGARAPKATGSSDERARGLRPRAGVPRARGLDQLQAADAAGPARPRRPDRLLDVLLHQLPAHAPAHPRVGRPLPRRRADDRRRPHARVRVRARAVERAREREEARAPLPGRARQRLRHVGGLAQPVLAGEVPDRPERARPLLPLRRRRVRHDGGARSARCSAKRRPGGVRPRRRQLRTASSRPRATSATSAWPRNGGDAVVKDEPHAYTLPGGPARQRAGLQRPLDGEGERAVAGPSAGLRLQYRARDVYLVLTGKGSVQVLVDGKPERTVRVAGDRLYTLVERPKIGDHLLELHFSPGVAGYAFTFG